MLSPLKSRCAQSASLNDFIRLRLLRVLGDHNCFLNSFWVSLFPSSGTGCWLALTTLQVVLSKLLRNTVYEGVEVNEVISNASDPTDKQYESEY